mmetsp:Transcript_30707/g.35818  ORF Transcript_30707/g.35818 Transcript_30707/m.35818 type:complete len:274 (+) Transcript_30707:98-919(+)
MPSWWSQPTPHHAYILSCASVLITVIAIIFGFFAYAKFDDSLILIYALENIIDFISTAIVLWRFNTNEADNESLAENREKRASVAINFVLIALGFFGLICSIDDLTLGYDPTSTSDLGVLTSLSFVSFIVFGILASFKLQYGKCLKSASLKKDALCSAIGALLSFTMFFAALLEAPTNGYWWIDPVVAFACGLGALVYGCFGVYKAHVRDGLPIFSCSWYLYNGGSGRNDDGLELKNETQEAKSNINDEPVIVSLSSSIDEADITDMEDAVIT